MDTRIKERLLLMDKKPYDDSNWREEYKSYTSNKRYIELLENGQRVSHNRGYLVHCIMSGNKLKVITN